MNPLRRLSLLLLSLLPTAFAGAQDQATTLLAASRRADVVVRATVLAATDPTPEWHRLQFRRDAVLKGAVGEQFVLLEPSGACCGRVLFSLQPGDEVLLFLVRQGSALHPFGGSRGVATPTPSLLTHVAALLAANDDGALANVLAGALAAADARIAADAAHALTTLPTLPLGSEGRARVATALHGALLDDRASAASLCEVAARLGDSALVETLLPHYLGSPKADQQQLLQRTLLRCPAGEVAQRLPLFTDNSTERNVRAARLLARMPTAEARQGLERLLQQHPHPRVQLCLVESLLQSGARGAELAASVPTAVTELANRRANQPKTYRAIRPQQP